MGDLLVGAGSGSIQAVADGGPDFIPIPYMEKVCSDYIGWPRVRVEEVYDVPEVDGETFD